MHTQKVYVHSATLGSSIGIVLAFVVILLATRSPLIAFLSALTISCILGCVLGMMVMLGW
jgi:hypothetical protein